jgi:S-adenosylmethionine hydrolase
MVNQTGIITLTTDFGATDHYVATMKGVILTISPDVDIVDICHDISSYDIIGGALTIAQACRYFPAGSIHLAVVDPGVGGTRRAIAARTAKHVFIAPDNGLLTFALEHDEPATIRQIVNDRYFLHPVSNTFHGRDIFAPVAAHVSRGVSIEELGPEISDPVRLALPRPRISDGVIQGSVLKIDKFGNIVTNVTPHIIAESVGIGKMLRVRIAGVEIAETRMSYAGANSDALFAIFGSMGFLEVAMNQHSAASALGVKTGDAVEITAD